jgi:hypothetical protein
VRISSSEQYSNRDCRLSVPLHLSLRCCHAAGHWAGPVSLEAALLFPHGSGKFPLKRAIIHITPGFEGGLFASTPSHVGNRSGAQFSLAATGSEKRAGEHMCVGRGEPSNLSAGGCVVGISVAINLLVVADGPWTWGKPRIAPPSPSSRGANSKKIITYRAGAAAPSFKIDSHHATGT